MHPFALEGMSDVAGARKLIALHPHQADDHALVGQALQTCQLTNRHLLDGLIVHVAPDFDAFSEPLFMLHRVGQAGETGERIAR
jgi:hypothetical protein